MVMKRNAMRKNLRQSIKRSLGRYIAIALIIALGAGIFVGLRMTKSDMIATGQVYTDAQNMFDLRLICSYGWSQEQLEQVAQIEGLVDVEGVYYTDLIVSEDQEDSAVYRFYTIPETVDQLVLLSGRMPESADECLIDGFHYDDSILGTQFTVTAENDEDTLDTLNETTFTVVGYVSSPLYMDMNRGTTSVGSGVITDCLYVLPGAFDVDYYTEIHVTIPGDYAIYSDEYNDAMDAAADAIEPEVERLAQERLEQVRQEAEEEYQDGLEEYQDGVEEYIDGLHEAYEELHEAYDELLDAEQQIADNEQLLLDSEEQIAEAKQTIQEGKVTLQTSRQTLAETEAAAYEQITEATTELLSSIQELTEQLQDVNNDALAISTELATVNAQIAQIESGRTLLQTNVDLLNTQISIVDSAISATETALAAATDDATKAQLESQLAGYKSSKATLQQQLDEAQAELDAYDADNAATLAQLNSQRTQLENEQAALEATQSQLEESLTTLATSIAAMAVQQLQMESQFAAAEAQITAGEAQLEASEALIEIQEQTIADGWVSLEEAKTELADGWEEYRDGRDEALQELADARAELVDARSELADARQTIDDMTENTLHILDRNTNVGYASLDSSSDIVEGVSRVFPAFFLLIAALVCITTMTRMVDEERTQIGTLKALGYSNNAIIGKYLFYAASSALLGCGVGVLAGSIVFPMILWEAYKMMLFIQDRIVLTFDLWLCLAVVLVYTAVELLVTWYCCHKTLEEVPAELIRPKAPTAGKQMVFEKLPFWKHVSFLNKVTIRNIFRYHQRLAMMLVGIGGCTALLLTGFGLRDSIMNIVDYQFEEVTIYDLEVYFSNGLTDSQMSKFQRELEPYAEDLMFFNQISVEMDFDDQTREIYMISAGEELANFIDLHYDDDPVDLPGLNEMLLSAGVAEALGVDVGDTVTLRDADMRTMDLTVSGIYYNHVYNYAIVSPQTVEACWDEEPELQMAYVRVADGVDPHEVSAVITGMDTVLSVSVSEDLADTVRSMMDALDLVVIVIVFCAALLAATVLYNLTNININERMREIATIKVLGFNAFETAMYIFKENLSLSAMGTVLGLLFGKLLLNFVMSQIKINMIWFLARALPLSYVLSVVMTMLMAVIVDFLFYFKLDQINMAESLKSVE